MKLKLFHWGWLVDPFLYFMYSLLKSEPPKEIPPPELEVPDTTIGTPIPVLFGTKVFKSPILVDYGDVKIIRAVIDASGKK